jgi:uncharacterized membrane protein
MSDLIAIAYAEEGEAAQVLDTLRSLQVEHLIDLEDACYVTKDAKDKVKLHQAVNLMATGATSGAIWGGLVGLLFLMPLVGMIVGAAAGALSGSLSDYGIHDRFIKDLSAKLQPNSSALFVLVRKSTPDKVLPEVSKYGGTVLFASLSNDDQARLQAALSAGRASAAQSNPA